MADIQVKRKTSLSVTETFVVDGAPQDLDSGLPMVTTTAPDGTTSNPTASDSFPGRTTGQYRIVLPAQAECTWRDLTWTGTIGTQSQTLEGRVEWLGDLLFTLDAFRNLKVAGGQPFKLSSNYSDAAILETRAEVLDEFTEILGFPPVGRFRRETFDGNGGTCLVLPGLYAQRILSVTVNGVAQTASNYQVGEGNTIEAVTGYSYGTAFTWGRRNLVVEWVEGWPRVKGDGSDVAMLRAAMKLQPGLGSTATQVVTPDGSSYSFDPAGQVTRAGTVREFGVPAIDSWLNRHSRAGVAVA